VDPGAVYLKFQMHPGKTYCLVPTLHSDREHGEMWMQVSSTSLCTVRYPNRLPPNVLPEMCFFCGSMLTPTSSNKLRQSGLPGRVQVCPFPLAQFPPHSD
jgi:hypothetical protein